MKSSISSLSWISALVILLCGCANHPAGSPSWRESSGLKSNESAATLNALANDESASDRKRALAVFRLFANHVRPGQSAAEVHDVLANSSWLQTVKVFGMGAGSGYAPVEFTPADSPFLILLFPDKQGQSDWRIWLVLSGHPPHGPSPPEEVLRFFEGDPALRGDARLKEFALSFMGGIPGFAERSERFSQRGINVYYY